MSIHRESTTPVLLEVSMPTTRDFDIGDNCMTFVEERWILNARHFRLKAWETRPISKAGLHTNAVLDADDNDDDNKVVSTLPSIMKRELGILDNSEVLMK